jgi:transposase-like protein
MGRDCQGEILEKMEINSERVQNGKCNILVCRGKHRVVRNGYLAHCSSSPVRQCRAFTHIRKAQLLRSPNKL